MELCSVLPFFSWQCISDDSISVIDTLTDEVVNTPCARRGFEALGITGYIQGITAAQDDSIFVYGCKGNGAIVKFMDIINSNKYIIFLNKYLQTSR